MPHIRHRPVWVVALCAPLCGMACDGSASHAVASVVPDAAVVSPASCDLMVAELSAYQTVKTILSQDGVAVPDRAADLVQHRPTLIRAFLRPPEGWVAAHPDTPIRVHFTLSSAAGTQGWDDRKTVMGDSADADLDSTFNATLPASLLTADARLSADILEPAGCPATEAVALRPRQTGTVRVSLVPIKYGPDGSNRLPDTSDDQLGRYRDLLQAIYPVEAVDLTVRAPVTTDISLGSDGWSELLDSLRALRAQDGPANDLYYYGLVAPGATFSAYCPNSCTAGIAYQVSPGRDNLKVGVGVGFSGTIAADTLAHELGHQHGRAHAPCATTDGLDPTYPYPGGATGSWGFDFRSMSLIPPTRKDIMGYCSPRWISDYNYQALLERSTTTNRGVQALTAAAGPPSQIFWVTLVGAAGQLSWGQPMALAETPPGDPEIATVLGADGQPLTTIVVHRVALADVAGGMVVVQAPQPAWTALRLTGSPIPLSFAAATGGHPLRP